MRNREYYNQSTGRVHRHTDEPERVVIHHTANLGDELPFLNNSTFWTPKQEVKTLNKCYHTFKFDSREITLCVLAYGVVNQLADINIGYSVCLPGDKFSKELSRSISLGRAEKSPIKGGNVDYQYGKAYGVLKSIAKVWEFKIKENPTEYIKGYKKIENENI